MAKLVLTDLANLQNETTAVSNINANHTLIENALENTLSRNGATPNTMAASLDMNSNRILNLPSALSNTEPVRLGDLSSGADGFAVATEAEAEAATSNTVLMTPYRTMQEIKTIYPSPYFYDGLEFGDYTSVDPWQIQINVGMCSIGDPTPTNARNIPIIVSDPIIVDLSTNGANGMALTETAPPAAGTTLNFYLFKRTDTGQPAVLCSSGLGYSALIGKLPSGFDLTYCRKLRFGIMPKPDGSGLPSFRHRYGTIPSVTLLDPDDSGLWNIITAQTYAEFAPAGIVPFVGSGFRWIPDNARSATLNATVTSTGNPGGTAWYHAYGLSGSTGIPLGWVPGVAGWTSNQTIIVNTAGTTANQAIQIKCEDPSVKVTLQLLEYSMDELS